MKHQIPLLIIMTALFLSQCAPIQDMSQPKKITPTQSQAIERAKPKHVGTGQSGSYGLYDYTVYNHSVKIRATSGVVRISYIDVFDINRDGYLDSVFAFQDGVWRFVSTLGPQYRLIPNSTSSDVLRDYIGLAHHAKREIDARNARAAEQKRRAEIEAFQQYQEGVQQGTIPPNHPREY